MGEFVRVASVTDLDDESVIQVKVDGHTVALAKSRGRYYALRDVCSHAEVPLSEGDVEDGRLECWLHGSQFDLRTGRPCQAPATKPVPVYSVKIDGDDVLVAIQES